MLRLPQRCQHFQEANVVSYDIILRERHGEEVLKDLLKHYQTVENKSVSEYSAFDQDKILSRAFSTDRKDTFF